MFATSCTVILAQPFFHVNPFFSIVFSISYFYNLKYLQDYDKDKYLVFIATGELMSHLLSIQEEAEQMRENMLPSMKKEWGLTEQLKIDDQMKWVGLMNNLEATIKEIIFKELVYV